MTTQIVSHADCTVDGCSRCAIARGWCYLHYKRWQSHGDPMATLTPMRGKSLDAKLLELISFDDAGCWLWGGTIDSRGYGVLKHRGKVMKAHRAMFSAVNEPIPQDLHLDHVCRVTACVNPNHLEPVTAKTNILRGVGPAAINARKTHCIRGHSFNPENTFRKSNGGRGCRICKREYERTHR